MSTTPHHLISSFHNVYAMTSSPSSLLINCPYHFTFDSLIFSAMSATPYLLLISSFHNVPAKSMTGETSSLLITCSYHLNLAAVIFFATSTTPYRLLISSFHNVYAMTSSPLPLTIMCPCELNLASLAYLLLVLALSETCIIQLNIRH
jgi:hypothetical protein